jgi:hypothetical protein
MFVWVLAGGRIFVTSIVDSAIQELSRSWIFVFKFMDFHILYKLPCIKA